ncbi:MAG: fatty acid metabolism transcriptional regulator FadR [Desulfobacula sp.]|uniref:fatty acid metabolism transcriptional regulator FadR n=1 Tax=Desulfobacula sp. TaxID=2593537 RepID=UPI0025BDC007|nr:fatty acid metabolism transcriptional regulator FadR [Desulfobacula sp.]MCD4720456.1 fatty acid metabolism transcriptional regulator FadR [Desulfobacula sp.]
MVEKLLKPAEFAEKQLLEAILGLKYNPGEVLPAERLLAIELGVTRPTLRETLQRLSKEGWITIRHGKPTKVNDYLKNGGLGILSSLARYGKNLSTDMVSHLLEVRTVMFPDIAQKAISNSPEEILTYLRKSNALKNRADAYAEYDWGLQMLMVKATKNPVFNMILNDFEPLYAILGEIYFQKKNARVASLTYYSDLIKALEQNNMDIKLLVEETMIHTQKIWEKIR